MSKFYIKKQYKTTNSVIVPDFVDAEQAFHLASAPESDMGWIIIAPWTTNEETCFFHKAVGNTVYVHWVNRSNPNIHAIGTIVYYASTIDYLNYLLSRQNHQMYIYKTSDDNVVVLGWEFYLWGIYTTVPDMDTSLGLPNQTLLVNSTSWIHLVNWVYTILPARNNAYYYIGNVITDIAGVVTEINLANVTHLSVKWDQWDPGPIGPAGVNYRWSYGSWVTYAPHDVVLFNWQLYINILGSTWSDPSNPTNWNLFLPKSDLTLWLVEDKFIDVTSSVFSLTQTPFDSSVVFVFIRQRKGILWVDYTYSSITNTVTLLPDAISATPQTVEILYAISWVGGSGWSDHLVLWDVTDTVPWTLFDKMLGQWDLTVSTLEATPGDVNILISAPERTYTSNDNSVDITLTEFTDIDWLIHKNVDLSAVWGGGGWATSTTVNSLNFAFADELNITSTDTSVGVATTQNVDGDINIDLSVVIPDTTINGLTFDLTDSLNVTSTDSSVTITSTQNPAGDITLDLSATPSGWATSTTVNGLTFDLADTLTFTSNDTSAVISAGQNVNGNVQIDISVPTSSNASNTQTTYVAWTNILQWKPVFVWSDWLAYLTGTTYVGIATNNAITGANVVVGHIGSYTLGWFNIWDSIYLGNSSSWSGKASMPTPRWFAKWVGVNGKIYVIWGHNWSTIANNEEYNPLTDTWAIKAPMPAGRNSFWCRAVGVKIYCMWGFNSSAFADNFIYDTVLNSWSSGASLSATRWEFESAVVGSKIYCIGWHNGLSSSYNSNEEYNTLTNSWTTKAVIPQAIQNACASSVGTKVYVMGWYNSNQKYTNYEYDTVNNTWVLKPTVIPIGIYAMSSITFNDKIYVTGYGNTNYEYNPATDTWTAKSNVPTSRQFAAVWLASGKMYVIGWSSPLNAINEEYDIFTDTWSKKQSMITARRDFAWVTYAGNIYAIGWFNWVSYVGVNEQYSPLTNTWTTKASMLTARSWLTASVVNDRIYCIGWFNSSIVGNNEEYNPIANTWIVKTIMPTARQLHVAPVVNGKIYCIGGDDGSILNTNQEYDPVGNSWTTKAVMTTARHSHWVGVVNNKIYCIGWFNGSNLWTNQEYDPSLNTWSNKTAMTTPRSGLWVATYNNKIYCIGGNNWWHLNTNEEYTPLSDTWSTKQVMPTARTYLVATELDGNIYAIGWYDASWVLSTSEAYNISPAFVSTGSDTLGKIIGASKVLFYKI